MKLSSHSQTSVKRFFLLIGVFCFTFLNAQINLVPNPSFEDTIAIPNSHSQFSKCQKWYAAAGSPDYFSVYAPSMAPSPFPFGGSVHVPRNCFGYQNARTGDFYSGIILCSKHNGSPLVPPFFNTRECIGTRLTQPLLTNHSYSFTMYYSLSDGSELTTNQLTAYFTNSQFIPPNNLSDTNSYFNYLQTQISHNNSFITDTMNWVPLTGCFIAKGGEEYFIIGNLKDALHSPTIAVNSSTCECTPDLKNFAYIFIDDVSLYDMGLYLPAVCKNDTLVCNGTGLNISNNSIKDSSIVTWTPPIALTCTNCPNPVASPTTTTLYYLNKSICGASSKDSILVQVHTPTTVANGGNDKAICIGDYVQIGTQDSLAFTNYSWQFAGLSCINCAQPYVNPIVSTTYTVQRTECSNITSDTIRVIVNDCDPTFILPNVFTPNGDDINDTWGVNFSTVNSHITNFKMSIYDRWGLLVYFTNPEASTPKSKWDGRTSAGIECNAGVYYYIITFEKNDEHNLLKGYLSLFR